MKLAAVLSLFCVMASADKVEKPVCNSKIVGRFWPAAANDDRDANRRLAQRGELEICTYGRWHYSWKPMSVNVHDLAHPQGKQLAQNAQPASR